MLSISCAMSCIRNGIYALPKEKEGDEQKDVYLNSKEVSSWVTIGDDHNFHLGCLKARDTSCVFHPV